MDDKLLNISFRMLTLYYSTDKNSFNAYDDDLSCG